MQVSSANRPCDRSIFKFKLPHKEENKLPPNAKIQETDPLVGLTSIRYVTFYKW